MIEIVKFFLIGIFLYSKASYCQSNLEIRNEFKKLKLVMLPNYPVKLKIIEKGAIESIQKEKKIVFSNDQFKKVAKSLDNESRIILIRIILAHELAHQIQFKEYAGKLELNDNLILRMQLEAQADILAGYYYCYIFSKELIFNVLTKKRLPRSNEETIFKKILEIGIDENSIGTHPSSNDRYLAFYNGYILGGTIGIFDGLSKFNNTLKPEDRGDATGYAKNNYYPEVFNMTGFYPQKSNLINWSFKKSRQILNLDPKITRNIVLLKNSENENSMVKYYSTSDYPYIEYDLNYMNISSNKVCLDMEIYILQSIVNSPYKTKIDQRTYSDTLSPREIINIKGKLRWDKINTLNNFKPSKIFKFNTAELVFPTPYNNNHWVSSSYADKKEKINLSEIDIEFLGINPQSNNYDLGKNFLKIIRKLKYLPEDIYLGIGCYSYNKKNSPYKSSIEYNSPLVFDKNSTVKVNFFPEANSLNSTNFSTQKRQLEITYLPFHNRSDALKKMNKIEEVIDFSLPNKDLKNQKSKPKATNTTWEKTNSTTLSSQDIVKTYYRSQDNMKVLLKLNKINNYWHLSLIIQLV